MKLTYIVRIALVHYCCACCRYCYLSCATLLDCNYENEKTNQLTWKILVLVFASVSRSQNQPEVLWNSGGYNNFVFCRFIFVLVCRFIIWKSMPIKKRWAKFTLVVWITFLRLQSPGATLMSGAYRDILVGINSLISQYVSNYKLYKLKIFY